MVEKVILSNLIREQKELSKRVRIKNQFANWELIGGADCAFGEKYLYCAFAVFSRDLELKESVTCRMKISFPYIPGFLSYREKDAYIKVYNKLQILPDVILLDGQGISHPRRFGLACHIGLLLDRPTIGCAKSRLVGKYKMPGKRRGSSSPLVHNGEIVGYALRTQDNVSPLFVSPGHKIDFNTAKEIVLKMTTKYRIPEPLRYAHMIANRLKRIGEE